MLVYGCSRDKVHSVVYLNPVNNRIMSAVSEHLGQ